ncbi:hypothetical protein [Vogesella indigofera]|uniref:hypothetical protein n=1 Tax=Vogesella indigofera TaxID=45465 RepID=UPI0035AEDD14
MRKEFKIYCTSPDIKPDHLIRLFHFGRTEAELASVLHVDVATVRRWKSGTSAVPILCVKHLELLDADNVLRCPGVWHGTRVEGSKLVIPYGTDLAFDHTEVERLSQYRRLYHLHALQTDLVEKLMMERDFYRENCHRQAKFGLMLNRMFG